MSDIEQSGETPKVFDVTTAGPLTLHERGISFAVDGMGRVLRHSDGTPIDGQQIADTVSRSGSRLTNAEAAGRLVATQELVHGVQASIDEIKAADSGSGEVIDPRSQ